MDIKIGDKATITYQDDGTTARVKVVEITEFVHFKFEPTYWFEYLRGEKNRKIEHPLGCYCRVSYFQTPPSSLIPRAGNAAGWR